VLVTDENRRGATSESSLFVTRVTRQVTQKRGPIIFQSSKTVEPVEEPNILFQPLDGTFFVLRIQFHFRCVTKIYYLYLTLVTDMALCCRRGIQLDGVLVRESWRRGVRLDLVYVFNHSELDVKIGA